MHSYPDDEFDFDDDYSSPDIRWGVIAILIGFALFLTIEYLAK